MIKQVSQKELIMQTQTRNLIPEYTTPFYFPVEEYERDTDPIGQYINQSALLVSRVKGVPFETARDAVRENMKKGGAYPLKDPKVTYLHRHENQDRELTQTTLFKYIYSSVKAKQIIVPTMTCYDGHDTKLSWPVGFIQLGIDSRKIAKKKQLIAEMVQDIFTIKFEGNNQKNEKITNNSISGGTVTPNTAIFNYSTHSTLTSITRCSSAYANSNNEKVITGHRHYYNPDVLLNNIVSIISLTDMENFGQVVRHYGLRTLHRDEVFAYLLRSSRKYWHDESAERKIREYMNGFTELELTAVVYISDLYGIRNFNHKFIKEFFDDYLDRTNDVELTQEEATKIVEQADENIMFMVIIQNMEILANQPMSEWKNKPVAIRVANDVLRSMHMTNKYHRFLSTMFRTKCMPMSIAELPTCLRDSAVMSDTDSTIFTCQEWSKLDTGKYQLNKRTYGIYSIMTFILSESLNHILIQMSANMGITGKWRDIIKMKNEFLFPVFVPTLNTKHYYALQLVKEGNVYGKPKIEIKGVHLKSSNTPPEINKLAQVIMKDDVCMQVLNNKFVDLRGILQKVSDVEKKIINSLKRGEVTYLKRSSIKGASSYRKDEEESPYKNYLMWTEVFEPKYGQCSPPPYTCVEVPTILHNKTAMKKWITEMEDKQLAARIEKWVSKQKSDTIGSFRLPMELFITKTMPQEIVDIIDIRSVIKTNCHNLYFILETLGIFYLNENVTRLVSDEI